MPKINKSRTKAKAGVPALYDAEMAAAAQKSLDRMRVPTQGNRISIKGKQFSIGGRIIGPTLKIAVIDFGHFHAYYPGVYNEKNPLPPVCFALSLDTEGMKPHPIAPEKQHPDCDTCLKNQFGSATTGSGRGKACKEGDRLAVMHIDDLEDEESVAEGKIATLDLPAMSLKGWQEYSTTLVRKAQRELLAFVTELAFELEPTYPVVTFKLDGPVADNNIITALKRRQEEAQELILSPWQPVSDEKRKAAPQATGRGAATRKSGAARSRFN